MLRFASLVLVVVMVTPTVGGVFNDWPQAGFDQTHQGHVPPSLNSELVPFLGRWWNNLSIPGPVSSPTVREDIVYFGDSTGKIWAIDRESGGIIWVNVTVANNRVSGTAVGQDFVYALTESGGLYSFNRKTGRLENGYPISVGASFGSPMLHEDIIYIGSTDGSVKSYFVSTRQQRWSFSTSQTYSSSPRFGNISCPQGSVDGTPVLFDQWVMFGSTNKCFFALRKSAFGSVDPRGPDVAWVFKAEDSIRTTPVIDVVNRQVIFGDVGGNLYAVSVDSSDAPEATWKFSEPLTAGLSSEIKASPVMVGDRVIVGARNGNVRALYSQNGGTLWVRNVNGEVVGTPAAANGVVLVGSFDRNLYMLNVSDGALRDQKIGLAEITTWVAISGTQAFWGDRLGNLYSWGGQKPSRADVSLLSVAASLTAGQSGSIVFQVKNVGVLPAPNTTAVISVGSGKIGEINVPQLAPGQEHTGVFPYAPPSASKIRITVLLDATRQLKESDEANNEKFIDVEVAQPPAPLPIETSPSGGGPAPGALWILLLVAGVAIVARQRGGQRAGPKE